MSPSELEVRRATDEDLDDILKVLAASLGWVPDDQYADFFRWKHKQNPFGRSPAWVAIDGDRIVGLRVWLRWVFERGGRRYSAIRAVDTATHPDYQGRGIFKRLTLSSLDVLRSEGVDFVFNTPNKQSRPGYLKMGWDEVGKLPTAVRFSSPLAALRTVQARTPADKWSLPSDAGLSAPEILADDDRCAAILRARGTGDGRLRTVLDADVLRWRYGFRPLNYRAVHGEAGTAIFRLRQRGPAVEAVVNLIAADSPANEGLVLRRIAQVSDADHVLQITSSPRVTAGFLPLPGQGPILTWRELNEETMPTLEEWDLTMGDVELF